MNENLGGIKMDEKYSLIVSDVLKNYHTPLKRELTELEKLVFTIYKVHFETHGDSLERVHKLFGHLKVELESRMIKEERALFFMIKDYEKDSSNELLGEIIVGIESVEENNRNIIGILGNLREATGNYTVPDDACPTYENTFIRLKKVHESTVEYLGIEEQLFNNLKIK